MQVVRFIIKLVFVWRTALGCLSIPLLFVKFCRFILYVGLTRDNNLLLLYTFLWLPRGRGRCLPRNSSLTTLTTRHSPPRNSQPNPSHARKSLVSVRVSASVRVGVDARLRLYILLIAIAICLVFLFWCRCCLLCSLSLRLCVGFGARSLFLFCFVFFRPASLSFCSRSVFGCTIFAIFL